MSSAVFGLFGEWFHARGATSKQHAARRAWSAYLASYFERDSRNPDVALRKLGFSFRDRSEFREVLNNAEIEIIQSMSAQLYPLVILTVDGVSFRTQYIVSITRDLLHWMTADEMDQFHDDYVAGMSEAESELDDVIESGPRPGAVEDLNVDTNTVLRRWMSAPAFPRRPVSPVPETPARSPRQGSTRSPTTPTRSPRHDSAGSPAYQLGLGSPTPSPRTSSPFAGTSPPPRPRRGLRSPSLTSPTSPSGFQVRTRPLTSPDLIPGYVGEAARPQRLAPFNPSQYLNPRDAWLDPNLIGYDF